MIVVARKVKVLDVVKIARKSQRLEELFLQYESIINEKFLLTYLLRLIKLLLLTIYALRLVSVLLHLLLELLLLVD